MADLENLDLLSNSLVCQNFYVEYHKLFNKELKVLRDLAKESSSWDYNRVTKRRVSNLRYVKHYIVRTRSTRLLSNNYISRTPP